MQPSVASGTEVRVMPQTEGGLAAHIQAALLTHYTGEKDPEDNLKSFKAAMQISNLGNAQQCKLFSGALEGPVLDWFVKISTRSVH